MRTGWILLLITACCAALPGDAAAADRPNILLILADDLGYGDISGFRGDAPWRTVVPAPADVAPIETPNIDALAHGGLMFTDFHSNDSVCSPTRAALMTGRYQHRSGVVNVLGQLSQATRQMARDGEKPFVGLRRTETTVAEVLRDAGYRTACFGKWHLGPLNRLGPLDQGFDHYVGVTGGAEDNFAMHDARGRSILWRDREVVDAPGNYFTDFLADEAIQYMTTKSEQPFFVYLPFTAPHLPYFGPNDKDLAWDRNPLGPRTDQHQVYKEVVEGLDAAIRRIVAALRQAGLDKSTLIVFTSDNGPVDCGSCSPHRGRKTNLYEGGTRVPTLFYWPGQIAAGRQTSVPAMSMDLLPTLAAIGEARIPSQLQLDGTSLAPLLQADAALPPRKLFWERGTGVYMEKFDQRNSAVRDGDWKLVQRYGQPVELYDLASYPTEEHNVAAAHADKVAELQQAFQDWHADVYADCPYDTAELVSRLKQAGTIGSTPKAKPRKAAPR